MRRVLAAAFVLGMAFALCAPAFAATPSPKKMAAQIRVLQGQVKTLQKQVKKVTTTLREAEAVALVGLFYGGCTSAATADALQGGNAAAYGTTPVNDYGTCSDLSQLTGTTIARQPNTATVNVFQQLLNLFKPSASGGPAFARLFR